jgi:hypothetical protein
MVYLKDPQFREARDIVAERKKRFSELKEAIRVRGGWNHLDARRARDRR